LASCAQLEKQPKVDEEYAAEVVVSARSAEQPVEQVEQETLLVAAPLVNDLPVVALNPEATALTSEPTIAQSDWLNSDLYGHDNHYAALELVEITQKDDLYTVYFQSQFGMRCLLEFGADGQPSVLNNCTFDQGVWWVQEDHIELECGFYVGEHVCNGSYTIRSDTQYKNKMTVAIARR